MQFSKTPIPGCYEIQLKAIGDDRGFFFRQFCADEMQQAGIRFAPVQSNYSMTRQKGSIRGLHYQMPPKCETKLLRVLKGKVLDVCVDLRAGSPTFLQWHSVELDEAGQKMFLLPKGCAHGFQTLTDNVEMIYFHDEFYSKEHDRTALYTDEAFGIQWPLPVTSISEKDSKAPKITKEFKGLVI